MALISDFLLLVLSACAREQIEGFDGNDGIKINFSFH